MTRNSATEGNIEAHRNGLAVKSKALGINIGIVNKMKRREEVGSIIVEYSPAYSATHQCSRMGRVRKSLSSMSTQAGGGAHRYHRREHTANAGEKCR